MAILESVFAQQIIQKIGWTLIHFLWQAAAIAILLAILLKLLRKSSAGARYIIACLALALIVVSAVITLQLIPTAVPDTPLAPPASLAPAFDNTQAISVIEVP